MLTVYRSRLTLALLATLGLAAWSGSTQAADLEAGRQTFESVCAACHGATGRPDPGNPVVQALEPKPADLSDPLFNSREPASDWHVVVTHGGPALGLSAAMPAQGQVLSEREIEDVVAYAKTLADTSGYPPGELNFFLPVRTKKAYPEDEIVWKSRYSDQRGRDIWRNVIEIEKRFGKRSMGLVEIVHEDDGTDSEITEVELGVKTALSWRLEKRSILSGAIVLAIPTDSDASEELIPYLAYGRQFSEKTLFEGSTRVIVPLDHADEGEVEFAGIAYYLWTERPRAIFPALEITATVPFDDEGGDSVKWTALPQLRFGLTKGAHVALNLGVEFPLNDQSWDTRYHLTLLWDFADGSLFKGW